MDLNEYGGLTPENELDHWWHRTRFLYLENVVRRSLDRTAGEKLRVLEMGCGTAQNLRYLRSRPEFSNRIEKVVGVDTALTDQFSAPWLNQPDQLSSSLDSVEGDFHLLMALDVIEHIDSDEQALRTWLTRLRPGGTVFITVPAFQALWSPHDDLMGHKRRYTRNQVYDLAKTLGLNPISIHYFFGHLVVPAFIRKLMMCRVLKQERFGLKESKPLVNRMMFGLGKLEHAFPRNALMGTSIAAILEKPFSN